MKIMMKNAGVFATIAVVCAVGMFETNAMAEEGVIRGKVSAGIANYASPSMIGEISSTYPTLGFGVAYIWPSSFFADFSSRKSGSDSAYVIANAAPSQTAAIQTFSRTENALTVGMPLENGLQGNAGIFMTETYFSRGQTGELSQKTTGVTGGIGKGFPIEEGKLGVVAFNGGIALLKGSYTDKLGNGYGSNLSMGFSAGTAYSYAINKFLSASVDAKFQSYFIKYSSFSGDERIFTAAASLIGQF